LKKIAFVGGVVFLGFGIFAQELQHQVSVVNVEIPVRVFKGDTFIDSLMISDFEVFEDGKLQQIEAVYLIKKTDIKREEGKKGQVPKVARQFVLFFEMSDYLSEIDKAVDYFFDEVILPGDSLIVITPMKQYDMRNDALSKMATVTVKDQLRGKLRRDILIGASEYKNTIETMFKVLTDSPDGEYAGFSLEERLQIYSTHLSKLESLRRVDEKGLVQFAAFLKNMPGQKFVFLFYQKESVPQYDPKALMRKMLENQENPALTLKFMENFQFFTRDVRFDVEAVKKAYADSSISVHFLFLTKTPVGNVPISVSQSTPSELTMVERSEDIFSAFDEVAQATGGTTNSSANAAASFKRAVDASENYYLIYYKPQNYKADGQFHEIKVSVKTGNYRLTHRAGYIAK
jgi:VWFA-related protein